MPSKSFAIAKGRIHARSLGQPLGFTLAEILVVLAIMGLMAGVITTAIVRASPQTQRRQVITEFVTYLSALRLEAMRTGRPATLSIHLEKAALVTNSSGQSRTWSAPFKTIRTSAGVEGDEFSITFDATGRTETRGWSFMPASSRDRPDTQHPEGRRTIWSISFDPISGSPHAVRGPLPAS